MTAPQDPFAPASLTPVSGRDAAWDEARAGLAGARADADGAVAAARRSLAVAWESAAADRFRGEATTLLVQVDRDQGLLAEAAAVLAR